MKISFSAAIAAAADKMAGIAALADEHLVLHVDVQTLLLAAHLW